MNTVVSSDSPLPPEPQKHPWYHWRRLGFNFLTISLLVHFILGFGAAYLIVQTIQVKRKQTFAEKGQGPGAPTHAVEHKVQMQKQRQNMSAPASLKRVTTVSNSKIALPALPAMPKTDAAVVPISMAGMGGVGAGLSLGGAAGGSGGGKGGGGGIPLFGFRESKSGTLVGHLYDLKQDNNRHPTKVSEDDYARIVTSFVRGGFNAGALARFYRASTPLYSTRIFTPTIDANEGPKDFGVQGEVEPRLYVAIYEGKVIPTESGTYHFVGFGDDVLVVRFAGRVVLDRGYLNPSGVKPEKVYHYQFNSGTWYSDKVHNGGHGEGLPMEVVAGQSYDLQILIGEQPGGQSLFQLLLEKDGVDYQKDAAGNPILPVFRLSSDPPPDQTGDYPPFTSDGPVWKTALAAPIGGLNF